MRNGQLMSLENRVLMTLIWLRHYPTYPMLSLCFGASTSSVGYILKKTWFMLWDILSSEIRWPTAAEWLSMRGRWDNMQNVVGAIDGTSHEIYIPQTEPQQEFYSGHRKYHCIHTQVIIDNEKSIRYVHSGFLGHENDAHAYANILEIGPGQELDLPAGLFILADSGYPQTEPLVTPYKTADIIQQPQDERRRRRKFNIRHRSKWVYVEHVIKDIKTFRVIGSLYRHP
ncbi:uncharacterized protein LOC133187673 [Saccostrea echinata]|uniref:uncharacterized protein LOC133187673 n=1 Tax=Saccostrea echinata TaxID=191078 RepID=UPI002A7F77BF|nr:uncharacterized protein LOC133187673 [Saccostrea echinata]